MAGPLGTPQNDPDYLSQGASKTVSVRFVSYGTDTDGTGNTVNIANGSSTNLLPIINTGQYFEIRGATSANNNGLYIMRGTPDNPGGTANNSQNQAVIRKVAGALGSLNVSAGGVDGNTVTFLGNNTTTGVSTSDSRKSVYFDTYSKKIWLIENGVTSGTNSLTDDGITLQAMYSFTKEEWKSDNFLIKFDFPFTAITPEQFEIVKGWRFYDYAVANTTQTFAKPDRPGSLVETNGRFTRNLIRTGGWSEQYSQANTFTAEQYAGIITLGTFEDSTEDTAYRQWGTDATDTGAADNFVFLGPVNQAVVTFKDVTANTTAGDVTITGGNVATRTTGDWFAEGYNVGGRIVLTNANNVNYSETGGVRNSYLITALTTTALSVAGATWTNEVVRDWRSAYDNRSELKLFLRGNTADTKFSKGYDSSDLAAIGVTTLQNQVYRFPLTNALDPKINTADEDITNSNNNDLTSANTDNVLIRYFASPFIREVDSATLPRSYGIVIDAGTFSGVDLTRTDANTFATADKIFGVDTSIFAPGGTITVHNKQGNGQYTIDTIIGNGTAINVLENSTAWTGDASFTIERATPLSLTIEQIYNVVQNRLRLAGNVNSANNTTTGVVTGRTADELLTFVGDAITGGSTTAPPENPYGGGTGVAIEGFASTDRNDVTLVDNTDTARNFPFLAVSTLSFNDNLTADTNPVFSLFYEFTFRRTVTLSGTGISAVSGRNATIDVTATGSQSTDFTQAGTGTGNNESPASGSGSTQHLLADDYIRVAGCTKPENNGIYRIRSRDSATVLQVTKVDGDAPTAETGTANVLIDEDPIDSPDAIAVEEESGIYGVGSGGLINVSITASTFVVDYDYSNNIQGSRVKAGDQTGGGTNLDAAVIVRAIGFERGQFIEVTGTITRSATGTIAVTSGLERNYSNPA